MEHRSDAVTMTADSSIQQLAHRQRVPACRPSPPWMAISQLHARPVHACLGLPEEAVRGGVVNVDALVDELAVDDCEDRAGVDFHLRVVVEMPDAGDFEMTSPSSSCQTLIRGWASDFTLPRR